MRIRTLADVYADELQDMRSAETQLLTALPKMASASSHQDLRDAFNEHLAQTREHFERVQGMLDQLDSPIGGKNCAAMQGLVKECEAMIRQDADDNARDAGLICAAQKIEHYEIASYGCLRTFANLLGYADHARTLGKTLEEEKHADIRLSMLATSAINLHAMA